jgi:DeoR family transcriptional regulator of aga operon
MLKADRLAAILQNIAEAGSVDVSRISADLAVSPATLRRDLKSLQERGLLTRTHGGAVATGVGFELPLRHREARHQPEKRAIGRLAASLVTEGAVVGMTGGTTATEVARALAARTDLDLTIVTNALNIANELAVRQQIKLVVTGGVVRPQSYELIGPLARLIPAELTLDVTFLGVEQVDPELGASARNEGEAAINRLLADRAGRIVVVADSSKLGGSAFVRICPIERINGLITDADADEAVVGRFRDRGVDVQLV